jgi:tRNA/rRNA methyltransferase
MNAPETCVVLVRPAQVGNIAAACRAMKNMGLRDLRLVDPPAELAEAPARALAYGAFDVLDGARRFGTLLDAVADARLVVATSGRPELPAITARALAAEHAARGRGVRTALVFGPERTGLTVEELRLCHTTVRIPTAAAHSSLNLAQAVLIVGYELFVGPEPGPPDPERAASACTGELEAALADLRAALLAIGYLNPENPDAILAELRGLAARASPTPRELALLRGVARQIAWAGRVAGERRGDG